MFVVGPQEAKQIVEEVSIFAFSMLENYKTIHMQATNKKPPSFRASFNEFSRMLGQVSLLRVRHI
jgi:hypothetical protein